MNNTVPGSALACMAVCLMASAFIPLLAAMILKLRRRAHMKPFFTGALVFLLFSMILESLLHTAVYSTSAAIAMQKSLWLYALYGALTAAVFEETGRMLAFRFFLKDSDAKDAAMYGVGHGGLQMLAMLSVNMVSSIAIAYAINRGDLASVYGDASGETLLQAQQAVQSLLDTPAWMYLLSLLERISAFVFQICLSVFMAEAVNTKKKKQILVTYLLHFAFDFTAILLSNTIPLPLAEIVLAGYAVLFAWYVHKNMPKEKV